MASNDPLARLINTMMALGATDNPEDAIELRCLLRKIDWVADQAETALKRIMPSAKTTDAPAVAA